MNKPKAQGTAWETELVALAQEAGLMAGRLPEGGKWDAGDVWINDMPQPGWGHIDIPVVAWSRLISNGTSRRVKDGLRSVIVIETANFLSLCANSNFAFVAECKATERLNVTRELADAKRKLANWKAR